MTEGVIDVKMLEKLLKRKKRDKPLTFDDLDALAVEAAYRQIKNRYGESEDIPDQERMARDIQFMLDFADTLRATIGEVHRVFTDYDKEADGCTEYKDKILAMLGDEYGKEAAKHIQKIVTTNIDLSESVRHLKSNLSSVQAQLAQCARVADVPKQALGKDDVLRIPEPFGDDILNPDRESF